jgi:hypothetical protein
MKWKTTSKNENGRRPQTKMEDNLKKDEMEDGLKKKLKRTYKKMEEDLKKNGIRPKKIEWKTNQSTKITLIGCDTIVNSPCLGLLAQSLSYK